MADPEFSREEVQGTIFHGAPQQSVAMPVEQKTAIPVPPPLTIKSVEKSKPVANKINASALVETVGSANKQLQESIPKPEAPSAIHGLVEEISNNWKPLAVVGGLTATALVGKRLLNRKEAVTSPATRVEPTFATPEETATFKPIEQPTGPTKLAAESQAKFGVPLADVENHFGVKVTNIKDAEILSNNYKNSLSGAVGNAPAGVPSVNPMDQLTTQPPAPQLIQPKPPAGATPPAPAQIPVTPTPRVGEAVATGGNVDQAIKQTVANQLDATPVTPKPVAPVPPSAAVKVEGLVRDAQGNFQYPSGMSPAAIEGHKAFNQQYPEHARALEAEGKFGIVGGGAADNSLRNSYGSKLRKQILNEVNQGQLGGINTNYLENINPAIKALSTESGLGKTLAELKANNPKGGIHGPLGTPATIGKLGELVSKPGAVSGLVNKGSIPLLLMAMAEAANANQSKLGNAVVPPKTSEGGAAFGGFTSGKKYQSAKLRAEQGDVNTLPDPRTYAAVQGLMGVPPDQLGFSVLHPDYKNIRDVADPAYAASILATLLPGLSKFGKK